jgi:predicted flap endonuclease-1-like 5' DNA nuclease
VEARLADGFGLTALTGKSLPEIGEGLARKLTEIVGVGPKLAKDLNALGVFEVRQLAEMTDDAMRGLDAQMNGRPYRQDWFGQARRLMGLRE